MRRLQNPYSKFRYDGGFTPRYRVNPSDGRVADTYGVDLWAARESIKKQVDTIAPCLNIGNTWVVNHVYRTTQITNVDQPVVNDPTAPRWTFFKLFKL